MKRVVIGLLAVMALFAAMLSGGAQPHGVQAATPGTMVKPLLGCPDITGNGNVDLFNDILGVAERFGQDANDTGPGEPDGYHPLYDVKDANGQIDLFNDILYVADNFGVLCPAVDAQVAQATLWGIANLPKTDTTQDDLDALAALGYYRASTDVPGQGIHYGKLENWDGTFDPQAPEGVVYNNGKLAAQLYVIDGNDASIGWGTHQAAVYPPNWPPPTTPHDVDLEGDADGPQCDPACSWAAGEGWHMHYFLCTVHIGRADAIAIPAEGALVFGLDVRTQSSCASFAAEPQCTSPMTLPATGCYRFGQNVGWMGHLWNHELNPNQIPDVGGNNGRFADCVPDPTSVGGPWKAFNCPS